MKKLGRLFSFFMILVLLSVMFIPSALAATKNSITSNKTFTITTGSSLLYSLNLKTTKVTCSVDTSKLSSEEANLVEAYFTKGLAAVQTFSVKITAPDKKVTTKSLYTNQSFSLSGSEKSYKVSFVVPYGYCIKVTTSAGKIS